MLLDTRNKNIDYMCLFCSRHYLLLRCVHYLHVLRTLLQDTMYISFVYSFRFKKSSCAQLYIFAWFSELLFTILVLFESKVWIYPVTSRCLYPSPFTSIDCVLNECVSK